MGERAKSSLSIQLSDPKNQEENNRRLALLQKQIRESQEKLRNSHRRANSVDEHGFTHPKKTSPLKETPTSQPAGTSNSFGPLSALDIEKDWEDLGTPTGSIFDPPNSNVTTPNETHRKRLLSKSPNKDNPTKTLKKDPRLPPLRMPDRENEPKPPPVVLNYVSNFAILQQDLQSVLNHRFEGRQRGRGIEITTKKMADYEILTKHLTQSGINFHTYRAQEVKTIPVVMKGIDPSFTREDIREALTEEGFTVANLYRLRDFETGKATPTVFVDLPVNTKNRTIYDLRALLNMRIKIEERKKLTVTVCLRCSKYGHTKKYCHNLPCCGRCGGSHDFDSCEAEKPCCANCGGDHPVSYRHCVSYLEEEQRIEESRKRLKEKIHTKSGYRTADTPKENPWLRKKEPEKERETESETGGFIKEIISTIKSEITEIIQSLIISAKQYITDLAKSFLPEIISSIKSALK